MKAYLVLWQFDDKCWAVIRNGRRGPQAHSAAEAIKQYRRSGLIKPITNKEIYG